MAHGIASKWLVITQYRLHSRNVTTYRNRLHQDKRKKEFSPIARNRFKPGFPLPLDFSIDQGMRHLKGFLHIAPVP